MVAAPGIGSLAAGVPASGPVRASLGRPHGMATATMTREQAMETLARFMRPALVRPAEPDIVVWAESEFYIAETRQPIILEPLQKTFLRCARCGQFSNLLYSTVKKSGKTAINGLYSRFRTEFSGDNAEVYFIANAEKQAKDRAYMAALASIEKNPMYLGGTRRELPGQWRIIERHATHLPTGSKMQALSGDYESAAGGNPTLTSWTELWAFTGERFHRLFSELQPVPTRKDSQRLVETYAGFRDESKLLWDLYKRSVLDAHRLTKDELVKLTGVDEDPWPYVDEPHFYINEVTRSFAYWDEGAIAQTRMPWQRDEDGRRYYAVQKETEREGDYLRLHENRWVSSAQTFIQPEWWTACVKPLERPLPADWPIVVAVDGSVSSDCTAVVGVCREPVWDDTHVLPTPSDTDVRVVFAHVWEPPKGGTIDLDDVEAYLRVLCGRGETVRELGLTNVQGDSYWERWKHLLVRNVACITFDQYQLHQMMTRLQGDDVAWTKEFSQAGEREIADKQLYDLIIRRGIAHNNEFDPEFMSNAAAYVAGENAKNQNRLRIVKKAPDAKVDPVVALSMAARVCLWALLS